MGIRVDTKGSEVWELEVVWVVRRIYWRHGSVFAIMHEDEIEF
jgi:hypothetical protein